MYLRLISYLPFCLPRKILNPSVAGNLSYSYMHSWFRGGGWVVTKWTFVKWRAVCGRSQSNLNSRLSNLGMMLLAVRKHLKCLLAAVCGMYWTSEITERTAKRLAAIQAESNKRQHSGGGWKCREADAKVIKEVLSIGSRWPQADIQHWDRQGC